ncbi:NADH dehydrogenase [ubiquinone] 1 alpha subcomplex subunit 2 [Tamandua tetradactyla]|uniref:NADH dehydrogenase [ubiquinone] 1 alpha subcomplex subunit 2 n=1 Tax=Tamandua tetradactyla TaxID=48850 RepID=UPI004053CF22
MVLCHCQNLPRLLRQPITRMPNGARLVGQENSGSGVSVRQKMAAAAAVRAVGSKPGLREIRIHLCQRSPGSQGVRDFIEKRYVELKKANPDLPILIRECSDVQPKLWARYAFGQEKNVSLNNFSADQVTRALENVLSGKA